MPPTARHVALRRPMARRTLAGRNHPLNFGTSKRQVRELEQPHTADRFGAFWVVR
jgi:hypothetical protein